MKSLNTPTKKLRRSNGTSATRRVIKTKETKQTLAKTNKRSKKKEGKTETPQTDMSDFMKVMCDNFNSLKLDFTKQMSQLEQNIESKMTEKLSSMLDKKLEVKVDAIRNDMTAEVKSVVKRELTEIKSQVDTVQKTYAEVVAKTGQQAEKNLNIVIRNLQESDREHVDETVTMHKVQDLITYGMKLRDINVTNVVRKQTRSNKPGVIIATIRTEKQKQDILSAKSDLVNVSQYKNVYVEHYIPFEERRNNSNLTTLLREMGKSDRFSVYRGRIVQRTRGGRGSGSNTTNRERRQSPTRNEHRGRDPASSNGRRQSSPTYGNHRNHNRTTNGEHQRQTRDNDNENQNNNNEHVRHNRQGNNNRNTGYDRTSDRMNNTRGDRRN